MLELQGIFVYYQTNAAVRNLSISVDKGDFVTILGANGAGKTSTLNAISGMVKVQEGEIKYKGDRINGLSPADIAARGIIQIPEGRKLFPLLTVKQNLFMGAYLQKESRAVHQSLEKVLVLFPDLKTKLNTRAQDLSGGQQQMVAISRGLMAQPEVLLLDEPSLGLSPLLSQQLAEKIKEINREGTTVVLVEQNARLGLMLASHGYIMENGELILQGKSSDLLNNAKVKKAYLGV